MWCFRLLSSIAFCLAYFCFTPAQAASCGSVQPSAGPLGYQPRTNGDRCEGFFQQQVSAAHKLEFLSLLNGTIKYDLVSDRTLIVSVPSLSELQTAQVFLEARALRAGTYYRMDAVLSSPGTFKWPLNAVITPANLPADAIGVVAWVNRDLGKYYIPVSVIPENVVASRPRALNMIFRSSLDIELLQWRSWRESGARPSEWVRVGGSNSPIIRAGQAARFELHNEAGGPIVVQVAAKYVDFDKAEPLLVRVLLP